MKATRKSIAIKYGLDERYFTQMQRQNSDKADLIFSLHTNKIESIGMYIKMVRSLLEQIREKINSNGVVAYDKAMIPLGFISGHNENKLLFKKTDKEMISIYPHVVNRWMKITNTTINKIEVPLPPKKATRLTKAYKATKEYKVFFWNEQLKQIWEKLDDNKSS